MKSFINKAKYVLLTIALAGGAIFALSAVLPVQAQTQITVSTSVPGTYGPTAGTGGPGAFVANFYQFALAIGGILAFAVIVYGGVKYMTSSGNPSAQGDAKEWIESALLGLLLLVGAYFILSVVNPQLLNLNLPTLTPVDLSSIPVPGGPSNPPSTPTTGTPPTGCAGGGTCVNLPNCTPVAGKTNCGGAPGMATVLNCIDQTDNNYNVNEGYPPVGGHSDPGHNTGCAIDVHVSNCAQGATFMAAARACGASKVLNEYANCGGTMYTHTSGGNIHIDAPKGKGGC